MSESWPYDLPVFLSWRKTAQSVSAGRALDGSEVSVANPGGYWTASGTVKIHRESILSWRALYAALDGTSGRVRVPVIARYRPTDMNGRQVTSATANPIGHVLGRQGLGDNGGLGHREKPMMWTLGPSDLRSTRIAISHPNVSAIRPGHYFGIGKRVYLVARRWIIERELLVVGDGGRLYYNGVRVDFGGEGLFYGRAATGTRSGTSASIVEFWPPLREAVAGGTPLILGRPVCLMQFASTDTGALDMGESQYGEVGVEFVEAL